MAKVNLQYMKGVRTRFYNVLEKEVQIDDSFLKLDILPDECKNVRQRVSECKRKIATYMEKLGNQSEKLAQAIGDTDEEFTDTIIKEDSALCESALSIQYKLQDLDEDLKERDNLEREKIEKIKSAERDNLQTFCELQTKLQREFFAQQHEKCEEQMKMQHEYMNMQRDHVKHRSMSVKLPKLDIVSFNGNKLYWLEFWDSFQSAVHVNEMLSPVDKFNYLRGKLTGEARSAIAGLSFSNENYSVAIAILHERFGDKQEIIDLHYKRILNLAPAKGTTESLRLFMDRAERHLRSLEVVKENIDQHVFISMLRSKLPSDVLLQLELLKGSGEKWTVQRLRNDLRQYIVSREKTEKHEAVDISNQKSEYKHQFQAGKANNYKGQVYQNQSHHAGALLSTEKKSSSSIPTKKCRFCDKGHWSDECNKFKTVEERKKKIKGSCFRCLKDNHLARECRSSKVCVYCGAKDVHHRSLCDKRYSKNIKKEQEGVHLSQEVEEKESTREEVGLLSCDECVLMQTATTDITGKEHEKSEKVRLLLDSGSHRTYISKALAELLELEEEGEQEISVVTFGNDKSKVIKNKSNHHKCEAERR